MYSIVGKACLGVMVVLLLKMQSFIFSCGQFGERERNNPTFDGVEHPIYEIKALLLCSFFEWSNIYGIFFYPLFM